MDGSPDRVAFIHVMKTAGSFVNAALVKQVFGPRRYTIFQARRFGHDRDWLPEEIKEIVTGDERPAYVHSHSRNWPEPVFRAAQENGWYTMCYLRDPADQWCSYYFWSQERPGERTAAAGETLDGFLAKVFTNDPAIPADIHQSLDPPSYWRDIDMVQEYSDEAFVDLMRDLFGHDFEPGERRNTSSNRGYQTYRAEGLVSDETHDLILASEKVRVFTEIRRHTQR